MSEEWTRLYADAAVEAVSVWASAYTGHSHEHERTELYARGE